MNNFLTHELDIEGYINQLLVQNHEGINPKYEIRISDCFKNEFKNKVLYNLNCFLFTCFEPMNFFWYLDII